MRFPGSLPEVHCPKIAAIEMRITQIHSTQLQSTEILVVEVDRLYPRFPPLLYPLVKAHDILVPKHFECLFISLVFTFIDLH